MTHPLIGITSYNRCDLTRQTLDGLFATAGAAFDLAIVDNASTDGTREMLAAYPWPCKPRLIYPDRNVGCPRALNMILEHRELGQPFVKLDNDVLIETPGWIERMAEFSRLHPDAGLIGASYDGVLGPNDCRKRAETPAAWVVDLLPGHFVWHTGEFMDRAGYFDVLHPRHLYGFEDWIMCYKTALLGLCIYVLKDVRMRDLQTRKGYAPIGDEGKSEHTESMRPYFNRHLQALREGRAEMYTSPSGTPFTREKE